MSTGGEAKLYINADYVGDVVLQRREDSWAHGNFRAAPAFDRYAPLFRQWSIAMHADGVYEPISDAASRELRRLEIEIDRLRAMLHFVDSGTWVRCLQLNIDGPLIEWKRE